MDLPNLGRGQEKLLAFRNISRSPPSSSHQGYRSTHRSHRRHRSSRSPSSSPSRSPPHRSSHHEQPPRRSPRRLSRGSSASYSGSEDSIFSSGGSRSPPPSSSFYPRRSDSRHRHPRSRGSPLHRHHGGNSGMNSRYHQRNDLGRLSPVTSSSQKSNLSRGDPKRDPRDRSKREKWPNQVCILGEKVAGFKMHFCRSCDMPILRYSRLAPCKHIFCLTCGEHLANKVCYACRQPVRAINCYEFGTLFVCEMSSSNSADGLCHRGYCSARDLEAHHTFRHSKTAAAPGSSANGPGVTSLNGTAVPKVDQALHSASVMSNAASSLMPSIPPGLVGMTPSCIQNPHSIPFSTTGVARNDTASMSFPGATGASVVMPNIQQHLLMGMGINTATNKSVGLATANLSRPPPSLSRPF